MKFWSGAPTPILHILAVGHGTPNRPARNVGATLNWVTLLGKSGFLELLSEVGCLLQVWQGRVQNISIHEVM